MSMLSLLEAVGHSLHGEPVKRCGALLREAKAKLFVTFDERGTPRLTPEGMAEYRRLYAEEAAAEAS